jgi:cytidylate kinase
VAVIAMTREMGSLGKDVAAGLANELGLKIIHSEIVEHDVAERLGVKESAVHRYLEGGASMLDRWQIDKKRLSRYTAEEMLEVAQQGNVIIRGWGAAALLRDIPHVLSVRVCAPMPFRERVMMERLGVNDTNIVRQEIERNDAAHARTMRGLFGVDWEDSLLYHIVLNTSRVPIEGCVKAVRQLAETPPFQDDAATRSTLVDKLVETRVRSALGERFGMDALSVKVSIASGKVTLSGRTISSELSAGAEGIALEIAGVTDVDNRIALVSTYDRRI